MKGIKRGNKIKLLEEIDIADEQEIVIIIKNDQINHLETENNQSSNLTQMGFGEFIQRFRQERNLEKIGIETEELLEGVRNLSSGREVIW